MRKNSHTASQKINCAAILALCSLLLTGCGNDSLADRVYTQGIGLSRHSRLQLTLQRFEEDGCHTVRAESIPEALQIEEVQNGGNIFTGHTELLCLDGSETLDSVQELFHTQGLSPACKVLYAAPERFLQQGDCTAAVHTLRMAEENGFLPLTELSTVLNEWLGAKKTALLPSYFGEDTPGLVFLHRDGNAVRLSEQAAGGMFWLRKNNGKRVLQIEDTDVTVTRIRLLKTLEHGKFCCTLTVAADSHERETEQLILAECTAAIQEMQTADADVIGVQELLEGSGLTSETLPEFRLVVHAE